jgi:hypothetical protein
MYNDPWSTTNKIKCTQCGQYNPIEDSLCHHGGKNGDVDHFADFYTCSFCGHRGRRLIRLVAKIKDDGEEKPYDRAEGAFYESDVS